jgi:transcriptional regulator with XRE-family HTH domain
MKFHWHARDLRKKNGYRQIDMAEILNISESHYNAIELGNRRPSVEHLTALADFYHVTVDYLLGREKRKPESSNHKANSIAELISEDMSPHQIIIVKEFIQFIKQKGASFKFNPD